MILVHIRNETKHKAQEKLQTTIHLLPSLSFSSLFSLSLSLFPATGSLQRLLSLCFKKSNMSAQPNHILDSYPMHRHTRCESSIYRRVFKFQMLLDPTMQRKTTTTTIDCSNGNGRKNHSKGIHTAKMIFIFRFIFSIVRIGEVKVRPKTIQNDNEQQSRDKERRGEKQRSREELIKKVKKRCSSSSTLNRITQYVPLCI